MEDTATFPTTLPAPPDNCNIKVMSIEEFNALANSVTGMANLNLLEAVEAFSTSPDSVDVRWQPSVKLLPHIAAFKVRYREVAKAAVEASTNSLSTTAQTPFSSSIDQEYVSEFLSSNVREYGISKLNAGTRYSVCVSAYPSSIEYWAKFGDNMKQCTEFETRPSPEIAAWVVLGIMALLMLMVLILAAVVVHRRRMQVRQNRNIRLATSPGDYDTPVVLVAAGPQAPATTVKQKMQVSSPTFRKSTSSEQQAQQRLQQKPPPSYLAAAPYPTGEKGEKLIKKPFSNGQNHLTNMGSNDYDAKLAPIASADDEDGSGNKESSRHPIFLAAVATRGKQARPPLAHFTTKHCANQHSATSPLRQCQSDQDTPDNYPNVTLLPPHNDATSDLSLVAATTNYFRAGSNYRSGHYQHLLYTNGKPGKSSTPSTNINIQHQHATDTDTSTSTSGVFGEEMMSLLNNSSIDSGDTVAYSPQQHFPDTLQEDGESDREQPQYNRRARLLRKQRHVMTSTPPPPPPYEGVVLPYCNNSADRNNSTDNIDIDIQADTDGLICVI